MIAFEGTPTEATATATSLTITKPTGLADGEVLFAVIAKNDDAPVSYATASGFTDIVHKEEATGDDRGAVLSYKYVATASGEPADYTWTTGDDEPHAGFIHRVSGVHADVLDVTYVDGTHYASNDTTDCPSITTVTANAIAIAVATCTNFDGTTDPVTSSMTAPSGYTLLHEVGMSGSREPSLIVAYKLIVSPGADDPAVFGNLASSSNDWLCFTIALKAASTGINILRRRRM